MTIADKLAALRVELETAQARIAELEAERWERNSLITAERERMDTLVEKLTGALKFAQHLESCDLATLWIDSATGKPLPPAGICTCGLSAMLEALRRDGLLG